MAIVDRKWSALPVPYAMERPGPRAQGALLRRGLLRDGVRAAVAAGLADGVPARGDPAAARLRRVRDPRPVDHRAAHRRHGGARVPERVPPSRRQGRRGPRDVRERVHLPVPRVVLRPRRHEHPRHATKTFAEHNLAPDDIDLTPVRCEVWGGCAWINLDDDAPPLRQCIEPFATIADAWKMESLRAEKWYACRLPVNWKLAQEAFVEQYHVVRDASPARHPRAVPAARRWRVRPAAVHRRGDPLPAHDERGHGRDGARERRAHRGGPAGHRAAGRPGARRCRPGSARSTTRSCAGTATAGSDIPDLNELEAQGHQRADGLLLPALLPVAHVQQRLVVPLPPAGPGGDADGDLVARAVPGR